MSKTPSFAQDFVAFQQKKTAVLSDLEKQAATRLETLGDLLDDYASDLKDWMGATAANSCNDDEAQQDEAVSEAESWVTDHVSNGDLSDRISAVLWMEGEEKGAALIRKTLESPAASS